MIEDEIESLWDAVNELNELTAEIERLTTMLRTELIRIGLAKEALKEIADLSGLTLLGCGEDDCNMFPHCPEFEQRAHSIGANKAFEQAADIARAALKVIDDDN